MSPSHKLPCNKEGSNCGLPTVAISPSAPADSIFSYRNNIQAIVVNNRRFSQKSPGNFFVYQLFGGKTWRSMNILFKSVLKLKFLFGFWFGFVWRFYFPDFWIIIRAGLTYLIFFQKKKNQYGEHFEMCDVISTICDAMIEKCLSLKQAIMFEYY